MGDKLFFTACYGFLQQVSNLQHTFGGNCERKGVKTQVGRVGRKKRLPLGKFSPPIREEGKKTKWRAGMHKGDF